MMSKKTPELNRCTSSSIIAVTHGRDCTNRPTASQKPCSPSSWMPTHAATCWHRRLQYFCHACLVTYSEHKAWTNLCLRSVPPLTGLSFRLLVIWPSCSLKYRFSFITSLPHSESLAWSDSSTAVFIDRRDWELVGSEKSFLNGRRKPSWEESRRSCCRTCSSQSGLVSSTSI